MIPCEKVSSLPEVILKLGGKDYKLRAEDYTLKVGARGQGGLEAGSWAAGGLVVTLAPAFPGVTGREDHLPQWLHGHGHPPTCGAALDPG